jgi:Domain of unknown function (DUF4189)
MNKTASVLIALTIAISLMGPKPGVAEGALAVGSTGNVVKDGIAIGEATNYATREQAAASALAYCRGKSNLKTAPNAVPFCKVVGTFTRGCDATALDPANRTPGAGWAIAATKEAAESQALANCQATAGASRSQFCKIINSHCDTKDTDIALPK